MMMVLLSYIYLPVYIVDQGFAPLDAFGVLVSLSLVVAYFAAFETAKVLHRSVFDDEHEEKTVVAELLSEGQLHAFPSRAEAWIKCPRRRPLLLGVEKGEAMGYGSLEDSFAPTGRPRCLSTMHEEFEEDSSDMDSPQQSHRSPV